MRDLMNLHSITLEDDYVKLLPMTSSHCNELYKAGQDKTIWLWTTINYCKSLTLTNDWIESCLLNQLQGTQLPFVIFDKQSHSIVGSTSYLNIDLQNKSIEVGYTFLCPSAQQTHINRCCKSLLLAHAFDTLDVNRVQFQTHEKNEKSRRAIQGIGAKFEGIIRNCRIQHDGTIRSSAIYSIIKPEWPSVQSNLKGKIHVHTS